MQLSSVIVYGFCEGEPDIRINPEWLATEYPDIGNYALYLELDGCMGEVCYGIPCVLDTDTGSIMVEDVSKNKVKELFDQVSNYIVEGFSGKLGFYSVVGGDFYSYHLMYIPMDVDDSDSDISCSVDTDVSESDTSCTMDDLILILLIQICLLWYSHQSKKKKKKKKPQRNVWKIETLKSQ